MLSEPEVYYLPATKYVPNNKLPVLVYRKILPEPCDEDTATEFLERHHWVKGVSSRIVRSIKKLLILTNRALGEL